MKSLPSLGSTKFHIINLPSRNQQNSFFAFKPHFPPKTPQLMYFRSSAKKRRRAVAIVSWAIGRGLAIVAADWSVSSSTCQTFCHRENAGTLGMVPLIINPFYTLHIVGRYLLGIPSQGIPRLSLCVFLLGRGSVAKKIGKNLSHF